MSNVDDHPGSVTLGGVQQGVGHEQRPNLFGVDLVVLGVCPGAGRRATLGSACGRRDEIERAEALGGVIDVSTKETESGPGRGARGTPANRRRRPGLAREDLAHVVGIGLRLPPTWSGCATDVVAMQMAENDDLDVLGVHAGGSKLVPKTSASGEPTAPSPCRQHGSAFRAEGEAPVRPLDLPSAEGVLKASAERLPIIVRHAGEELRQRRGMVDGRTRTAAAPAPCRPSGAETDISSTGCSLAHATGTVSRAPDVGAGRRGTRDPAQEVPGLSLGLAGTGEAPGRRGVADA